MNRMKLRRVSRAIVATLLLATVLGGCIEVRIESVFDGDLGALHTLQTTIEREGLDQLEAMGGEDADPFEDSDETRAEAEAAGFTYEEIDNDEFVGWRVSKDYDDSSDLGSTLNEMFADSDPETETVNTFDGSIVKDGDLYRLELTVNSDDVFEDQESEADDLGMDPSEMFAFVYLVTMPGEVTETNGERVGDNQVRWDLPITGTTTLTAVSTDGGSGGGGMSIIMIAVIVAIVLAIAVAAYFLIQSRLQPAPLGAAPATTSMTPMAAGAGEGIGPGNPFAPSTAETTPPVEPQAETDGDGTSEPKAGPDDDTSQLPRA
ncbi:MAG TPA: hypothetical protein VMM78_00050 [Thermomicrobiales bacterium]|nr:hypothetical protein [Thermomicrobiales bacterium]